MRAPTRTPPFTFAEIVIGAPWTTRLLRDHLDNDKGEMLQRNMGVDEWSSVPGPMDAFALEREARRARAIALHDGLGRAMRKVLAWIRPGHTRA